MGCLLASQPELNEWSTHRSDAYPDPRAFRSRWKAASPWPSSWSKAAWRLTWAAWVSTRRG